MAQLPTPSATIAWRKVWNRTASGVVAYIACAGRFPEDINEAYCADVRRMLPLWGKTEAEFIRDVDAMIQRMEELECP